MNSNIVLNIVPTAPTEVQLQAGGVRVLLRTASQLDAFVLNTELQLVKRYSRSQSTEQTTK